MKRAWIAGSILILLCALSIWSSLCLGRFTEDIISSLEQAQSMAVKDNWQEAARVTSNAERRFRERYFYLHVTLRHSDIDAVEATFREVEQLLTYGERLGEYAAANAVLISQLERLSESEHFALRNIL